MEISGKRVSIATLAIPIFIEVFLRNLVGTANIYIIGQYSDNAAASVGVGNQFINLVMFIFNVIGMGAAVVITQNLGANRSKTAGDTAMTTIGINFTVGAAFSIILIFFSTGISKMLSLQGSLLENTAVYLRWTGASSVLMAVSISASIIFRCYGDSKTPMVAVTAMNAINLAGNYLVVFRPSSIPFAGIGGIGAVRLISEAVCVLFLIVQLFRAEFGFAWREFFRVRAKCIKEILFMGTSTGMEGISYNLAQLITTGAIVVFGAAAISTKVYVQNVCSLIWVPSMAIGQANQIMVGHQIGAGRHEEAYRNSNRIFAYIGALNVGLILLLLAFTRPVIGLFTANPEILGLSVILVAIEVVDQAGRSFNHTFNFALKGTGFVIKPMIFAIISIWSIQVGLGYFSARFLGWGVIGVWAAMSVDEWARGLACFYYWRTGQWRNSSLVRSETIGAETVPADL